MRATVFLLLCLAACATPEQINARDDATCHSYGFTSGTASYGQCRMLIEQQRQTSAAAANAQLLGAAMYLNSQPQPSRLPYGAYSLNPSITPFSCTTYGNTTNCR